VHERVLASPVKAYFGAACWAGHGPRENPNRRPPDGHSRRPGPSRRPSAVVRRRQTPGQQHYYSRWSVKGSTHTSCGCRQSGNAAGQALKTLASGPRAEAGWRWSRHVDSAYRQLDRISAAYRYRLLLLPGCMKRHDQPRPRRPGLHLVDARYD
jgi:hypothetical protein